MHALRDTFGLSSTMITNLVQLHMPSQLWYLEFWRPQNKKVICLQYLRLLLPSILAIIEE